MYCSGKAQNSMQKYKKNRQTYIVAGKVLIEFISVKQDFFFQLI